MGVSISREQLQARLREAGFRYSSETKRVQIWKASGSAQRIVVQKTDHFPEAQVRILLRQAALTPEQIKDFLSKCVKS